MKKTYPFHLLLISLCFFQLPSSATAQDFKTVGYFPTYRFSQLNNVRLDQLTHLNIAFANPDNNGFLTTNGVDIDPVVEKAHEAGLKVYIALAGGAAQLSDWEDWIKAANRPAFIHRIINYTLEHQLDGIDVDLEWGNVNEDYSGFVLELRDSVDQHNLGLSVAFPGTYRYPEVSNEALATFDWVNLMVYDLTGPWQPNSPGPHSPFSFAETSIAYWENQGLSKEKMTLGVPFYGYDFTNQNDVKSFRFSDIVAMNPDYAQLDQVGQMYYNGLPTIQQKTELALEELSGVMIWELGQDDFGEYSLLNRIKETIDASLSTPLGTELTKEDISVYPNPTTDLIQIELGQVQNFKLTLISIDGRNVIQQEEWQKKNTSISMEALTSGIYFLRLEVDGKVKNLKVQKL